MARNQRETRNSSLTYSSSESSSECYETDEIVTTEVNTKGEQKVHNTEMKPNLCVCVCVCMC